jgi:3-oxoacyl-[acyl-carrier protein] reductase
MAKVALITGGAKGIGRAIAIDLAAAGWDIALCYRSSEQAAAETATVLQKTGVRVLAEHSDVSQPDQAEQLVKKVETEFGQIDALINGAGPYHRTNILDETPEGWRDMFVNNLDSVFFMCKGVAGGMKRRKYGRIISFSMANADQMVSQPELTAHYIAKAGVLILSRSLAKTLASYNITVNTISPGFVNSGSAPESELASMVKKIPAGYVGDVKDAVAVVRFLLSDEARYVNGANIHLSGAWGI